MNLDTLIDCYQGLTPARLPELLAHYHPEARFRDPFNDVRGHARIEAIFRHMFATTESPRFRVSDTQREGDTAWLSWRFDLVLRGHLISIEGCSRLDFCADGRIIDHRDHWDSADLFAQLPLIGALTRTLKRRLATPENAQP